MMKRRSFLRSTLAVGLAAACLALNANAGSQISGRVQIKTDVDVNKVETGRNAWVHLGAVNLKNVNVGGDLNVNSRAAVGGTIQAGKASVVNLASVQLSNMTIKGPASFDLTARIGKGVTTEQGAEVMIGGVSITADENAGGYANSAMEQSPVGNQTVAVLSPALSENIMPVKQQPETNPPQVTPGGNDGKTSFDNLPDKAIDVTDQYSGAKRKHAGNCVFFAREYVSNIPSGATSTKGRNDGIKRAEKAGYGSFDMSKVRVGDAIHTKEGSVGHTAIVRGFDKNGNMILEEANYKTGRITVGRKLSPQSSKVIGWIRPV